MGRMRLYKDRCRLHPIIYVIGFCLLITLLVKILTMSLADEIGQARDRLNTFLFSKLCIQIMDSGSSLVSYQSEEDSDSTPFPSSLLAGRLVVHQYTTNNDYLQEWNHKTKNIENSVKADKNNNYPKQEEHQKTTIGFNLLEGGNITKEYMLTNGEAFHEKGLLQYLEKEGSYHENSSSLLAVGILEGDVPLNESTDYLSVGEGSSLETLGNNTKIQYTLEQLKDINFLVNTFYILDPDTRISADVFDGELFMSKDMTLKQANDAPQILIYHTHSQEAYVDSREGVEAESIVGVGEYLAEILRTRYGYNVIHDKSTYDIINGLLDRDKAYNYAEKGVQKILKENPTIEVIIDLHRDGVAKRSTMIDGKETAQIMLFNGLSRDQDGPIEYLENPNLKNNLAFSLQLQLKSNEIYPGLFYKNYLKSYRYNLHLRPKSMLIELGTYKNTLASARNAMEPFAEVLNEVLDGN